MHESSNARMHGCAIATNACLSGCQINTERCPYTLPAQTTSPEEKFLHSDGAVDGGEIRRYVQLAQPQIQQPIRAHAAEDEGCEERAHERANAIRRRIAVNAHRRQRDCAHTRTATPWSASAQGTHGDSRSVSEPWENVRKREDASVMSVGAKMRMSRINRLAPKRTRTPTCTLSSRATA